MAEKKIAITVQRDKTSNLQGGWTLGRMTVHAKTPFTIMTLEDEKREVKVKDETRIPAGIYEIDYNTVGGMNVGYKKDYPDIHKGMIEIKNVKTATMSFGNVYIHVGNYEHNTSGCILVGMSRNVANGTVGESRVAYRQFYKAISLMLDEAKKAKTPIYIEIKDEPKAVATPASTTVKTETPKAAAVSKASKKK